MHSIINTVLLLAPAVLAHSWIEQLQLISSNGTYTGDPGYARGYVARTDPTFDGYADKWQLPSPETEVGRLRINSSDLLCHTAQRTANYTTKYPKLSVAPDTYVALRYLENGHVTQPWIPAGKPAGSGTVFVYGTYSPAADEKIADVLQWTTDGTGGNVKGWLMTAQNFDDGRCHQPNAAPISIQRQMAYTDGVPGQESWCETDLHIPQDSKAGATLTLYWIWSWQTSTNTEGVVCGKDEYYTTCADVDIVDNKVTMHNLFAAPDVHVLVQQDPQQSAVSDYKSRTAFATTPNLITTEGCSITSVTSSSLPATLTQMTSLPPQFWSTFKPDAPKPAAPEPTLHSSSAQSIPTVSSTVTMTSTRTLTVVHAEATTLATRLSSSRGAELPVFKYSPYSSAATAQAERQARAFVA
ncbi:hypothetical protein AMS68_004447 [Peltaster fructicola]|uniref:DUF7492 domain-containing protein n=1 Tax=Peltaster fructicola TaxID=286661 RepID=A0A6H0XWW9_9PEZI|nr:hypothetical protein AMS68_004447 [Peltaster fructicola]